MEEECKHDLLKLSDNQRWLYCERCAEQWRVTWQDEQPDIRDEFAMDALAGLLASGWKEYVDDKAPTWAMHAYELADAMLIERRKNRK